eukprot:Awhi_evm1s6286
MKRKNTDPRLPHNNITYWDTKFNIDTIMNTTRFKNSSNVKECHSTKLDDVISLSFTPDSCDKFHSQTLSQKEDNEKNGDSNDDYRIDQKYLEISSLLLHSTRNLPLSQADVQLKDFLSQLPQARQHITFEDNIHVGYSYSSTEYDRSRCDPPLLLQQAQERIRKKKCHLIAEQSRVRKQQQYQLQHNQQLQLQQQKQQQQKQQQQKQQQQKQQQQKQQQQKQQLQLQRLMIQSEKSVSLSS